MLIRSSTGSDIVADFLGSADGERHREREGRSHRAEGTIISLANFEAEIAMRRQRLRKRCNSCCLMRVAPSQDPAGRSVVLELHLRSGQLQAVAMFQWHR